LSIAFEPTRVLIPNQYVPRSAGLAADVADAPPPFELFPIHAETGLLTGEVDAAFDAFAKVLIAVRVSIVNKISFTAEEVSFEGHAITVAVNDSVFVIAELLPASSVIKTGTKPLLVTPSPTIVREVYPSVIALLAAEAGATELSTPKPNEATATSATRLKVVFVDICFLSISRTEEFPQFGLNQISLIRFDESHVLIHQIPHRVSGRGEETYLLVCHLHRLR